MKTYVEDHEYMDKIPLSPCNEKEQHLKKIGYPKQNQNVNHNVHHNGHSQTLCLRICTETNYLKSNLTVWTESFLNV